MATVTHSGTLPDSSEKTDFYAIIDNATVTGIVNADCAAGMALADSKLAQVTTAGKVSGAALTSLANVPSGAGVIPAANLTSVAQKGANSDITSLAGLTTPLSVAQGGTAGATAAAAFTNIVVPRVFCSDWTTYTASNEYTITHNLGLTDVSKMIVMMYAGNDTGEGVTNITSCSPASGVSSSNGYGMSVQAPGTNSFTLQIGTSGVSILDANGTFGATTGSGTLKFRVIVMALE